MSPGKLIFDTASPDWPVSACPCRILDPDQTAVQTTEVRDGCDPAISLDRSKAGLLRPRFTRGRLLARFPSRLAVECLQARVSNDQHAPFRQSYSTARA